MKMYFSNPLPFGRNGPNYWFLKSVSNRRLLWMIALICVEELHIITSPTITEAARKLKAHDLVCERVCVPARASVCVCTRAECLMVNLASSLMSFRQAQVSTTQPWKITQRDKLELLSVPKFTHGPTGSLARRPDLQI